MAETGISESSGTGNNLVFVRKFFHTQNGDDILQFLIALQNSLNAAGYFIVFLAEDVRVKNTAGGIQWIYCRVNAQFGDGTVKYCCGIQVGEYACRSRVSQIVGWYIYSLYGSDRTVLGRSDSFLKFTDIGSQGWLVTSTADGIRPSRADTSEPA